MSTEVVMPQMGESIAEGTITKWLKKVGDRVERDEPLFEISTDKVDAEIPSPAAGTLTDVRFKEGETVEVNTVVAVLDGNGKGAVEAPALAAVADTATSEAPAEAEPAPPLSPAQLKTPAGAEAKAPQQPDAPVTATVSAETAPAAAKPEPATSQPAGNGSATATAEELRRTKSSPLVRKIAQEHGVDIAKLDGTGMSGRVTKNDILSFIESGTSGVVAEPKAAAANAPETSATSVAPAVPAPDVSVGSATKPAAGDRVESMTLMRKKIAEHMMQSRRTSAHVTTVYEIDMTAIARLRDRHKNSFLERTGTKLTFMPFIFQAVNKALRKFPIFNAQVSSDQIIYKQDINLGMAVALDWGLIVPVIKRADDLSISGLARAANDLAERARTKQLKPDEVAGGTFTITNPGVFGGLFGTPIINQPQLAILGVGKIEKRAKVITSDEGDDYIAIRWMAYFALSFDHRVIDGSDAERFLAYIKEVLESADFAL